MTDTRAASAATPADLDCAARKESGLNPSIRSAIPKSKATCSAKPLEMKAEKMAIQEAKYLFITVPKGLPDFCQAEAETV
jgi:hypothetical protein